MVFFGENFITFYTHDALANEYMLRIYIFLLQRGIEKMYIQLNFKFPILAEIQVKKDLRIQMFYY